MQRDSLKIIDFCKVKIFKLPIGIFFLDMPRSKMSVFYAYVNFLSL